MDIRVVRNYSFSSVLLMILAGWGTIATVFPKSDLVFESRKYSRKSAGCEKDENYCIRIEAEYPVAVRGPKKVIGAINDSVYYYVRRSMAEFPIDDAEGRPLSIEEIADRLLIDYEKFTDEGKRPWIIEIKGAVLHLTKDVAVIQLDNFSYLGGAHPLSFRKLINFDAHSGKVLGLEEMITDMENLKILTEMKFRQYHHLIGNLNDEGFFWGGAFDLAANFALTEKGLYFYYNPYEVAAYAVGATELLLPYEDLRGILKEKYLP